MKNMLSKKIFVIGSNSFSGSNFVNHSLQSGYEVIGISRSLEPDFIFLPYEWEQNKLNRADKKNFIFKKLDLNKDLGEIVENIDKYRPDYIVNFAAQGMVAQSWHNPTHWYKTNVLSQVALHDQLRKKDFLRKYVHVTTPEVYGNTGEDWVDESNQFSPSTPYAVSRAACDLHLKSFQVQATHLPQL